MARKRVSSADRVLSSGRMTDVEKRTLHSTVVTVEQLQLLTGDALRWWMVCLFTSAPYGTPVAFNLDEAQAVEYVRASNRQARLQRYYELHYIALPQPYESSEMHKKIYGILRPNTL